MVGNKAKGRIWKRVTFLTSWYAHVNISYPYVCVSGGKKYSFFGKFGGLCFLETPVLRFALLPYYRRIDQTRLVNCWKYLLQILEEFHQRWNFPICINAVDEKLIWDHLFSTCAKFSTKLTFLTPCTCTYQGVRNVSLSENFAYVLKDWPRGSKNSGFSYKN